MINILIVVAWIATGAAVGFSEVRQGHWRWLWLLGAMAGPLAIPLARLADAQEDAHTTAGTMQAPSVTDRHGLRVLAGIDGSTNARQAARDGAQLLGFRMAELTLTTVVDFEAAAFPNRPEVSGSPREDRSAADRLVERAASEMSGWLGHRPGTVVLAGKPSTALQEHASEAGYDLVLVSGRGRGDP